MAVTLLSNFFVKFWGCLISIVFLHFYRKVLWFLTSAGKRKAFFFFFPSDGICWFRCNASWVWKMFLKSKARSNSCCTNHPSKESHCQSLAERILFSVAIFDCLIVHTENLLSSPVAGLHLVPRVVFFFSVIQIVKLCMTISFCYHISEV